MKKRSATSVAELVRFCLLTVAMYFVLQAVIVIAHEYVHSTSAWLLGYSATPLTVVWGNPLTILGWDEGVPYDRLFPVAGQHAEAVIGGAPLLMHAIFVTAGLLYLVLAATKRKSRFLYYATYLFVVVNLTELIAYVWMRPFAGSGDTGRFNQGMMLSPWFLFGAGVLFTAIALGTMWRVVMPALDALFGHSVGEYRVVVLFTACIMFLWGSGLRVMWLYPDRQWKWGLSGVVASAVWVSVCLRRQ